MNIPRFTAEASLYKTNQRYQLLASWAGVTTVYVGLAQFLSLPDGQPDGQFCLPRNLGCFPDADDPTSCHIHRRLSNCDEVILGPCQCPGPPTTCGPCNQINPTTLGFMQTCTTGGITFTRPCTSCTPETRIGLPWPISDRCIQFCCTAATPSSCSLTHREC